MDHILSLVRNITLFLLFGNLLANLFNGSSYRKYFNYVIGLIVLVLAAMPILTFLTGESTMENYLIQAVLEGEKSEAQAEIHLAGEETKEKIRDEYIRQIRELVSLSCGFPAEECDVELELADLENAFFQIERIRVYCPDVPIRVAAKIRDLSVQLGVPEEQIEFLVKE